MSVRIMSAVFDIQNITPTQKLILLCLADHADDAGRCYPSMRRLGDRTCLTERAVRKNLRDLEAGGYLRTIAGSGPSGCNVYFVSAKPSQSDADPQAEGAPTPGTKSPRNHMPPEQGSPTPGTICPSPPEPRSPKPSRNHQGTISPPIVPQAEDAEFDRIWACYPRKVNRKHALKAWKAARKKVPLDEIEGPLIAYANSRKGKEQKYTSHLASWLNSERWNDDQSDNEGSRTTQSLLQKSLGQSLLAIESLKNEI